MFIIQAFEFLTFKHILVYTKPKLKPQQVKPGFSSTHLPQPRLRRRGDGRGDWRGGPDRDRTRVRSEAGHVRKDNSTTDGSQGWVLMTSLQNSVQFRLDAPATRRVGVGGCGSGLVTNSILFC